MRKTLSGDDVISINDRIFTDLADGDFAMLSFENEVATVTTGKNGNSIYSLNTTGRQGLLTLRLLRASADDKYLNNLYNQQQKANFGGFVLMTGEFIKKVGDGQGNISNDTYILSGGIFKKEVDVKSNVEGDTEQSVSIYEIEFSNAPRVIS